MEVPWKDAPQAPLQRDEGPLGEAAEGSGLCCDPPGARSSKTLFPLVQERLLQVKAEGEERLELRGRAGDAATPAPTA